MESEEQRPTTDYAFLVISGKTYVQRSPLAALTPTTNAPGVVGFFQVDEAGSFATPLLPNTTNDVQELKLTTQEHRDRFAKQNQIRELLDSAARFEGRLEDRAHADPTPAPEDKVRSAQRQALVAPGENQNVAVLRRNMSDASGDLIVASIEARAALSSTTRNQQLYDQLSNPSEYLAPQALDVDEAKVGDLNLQEKFKADFSPQAPQTPAVDQPYKKRLEKSRAVLQEALEVEQADTRQLTTFDSSVDPFRMDRLDRWHWVLFRNVWTEEQRYVQGFIVAIDQFLDALVGRAFANSKLAPSADLIVAADGNVIDVFSNGAGYDTASDLNGDILLRSRMPDPGGQLEFYISASALPYGAGSLTLLWIGGVLTLVLCAGFWWIYRLGVRQIALAEQQQDFVSAVSHELKTPLTSIRMYGEILQAGWADEAKRKTYYEHIFQESERLTRLINNVLSLARITKSQQTTLAAKPVSVQELVVATKDSTANAINQAGFTLETLYDEILEPVHVLADVDAFAQIMINLVDNGLKFSGPTGNIIQLGTRRRADFVEFWVRDYGPGIDAGQLKKIFRMFYRIETELTRETSGTGIGLALVSELIDQMHAEIDVYNCDPGTEFRVRLPVTNR